MLSFYNVLKRIKASGWIVILLLSIMVYIGIIHFTGEKASTTSKFVVDIETEMEESKEFTSFISIQTFDNEEINQLIWGWVNYFKTGYMKILLRKIDTETRVRI